MWRRYQHQPDPIRIVCCKKNGKRTGSFRVKPTRRAWKVRTQKRQRAIVTLSDQNHQQLEGLREQREELLGKYEEQASELKQNILEKENELALLNIEIAELREFKSLQQQQLSCIAELEKEVVTMRCRHSESLQALKSDFLREKERYQAQAQREVNSLALAANKEASECLLSHTQEVAMENRDLRAELQELIQRADALRTHQDQLQAQQRQLLLEKEYVHELRRLRAAPHSHSTPQGGAASVQVDPAAAAVSTTATTTGC
ncbi:basal body-orientation factor 1-like isoform X3 [Sardina pilchardus]|uniref:basal body-orientation factor 1-like isoform X3 n=1 Tax=Sardina pilchardus TaxID=27697 RepID=UPI002E141FCD